MKKTFTKLFAALALLAFFIPSMIAVGQTTETKTEGFETATAGTTYNSTQTYAATASDCGIAWTMYYGTVSTNAKINGSKSAQMRWYSSATSNYPYIRTTTAVENLTKIGFNAKVGNTNVKMDVQYSTDGNSWTTITGASAVDFSYANTVEAFEYSIPSGGKYVKIAVSSTSTAPSSGNYIFVVDDVVFTYTVSTPTTYTVTYDCNGGESGCPDPSTISNISSGTIITLANAPSKTGYDFIGWSDGGTTYAVGNSYTVNSDVTFTAQWQEQGLLVFDFTSNPNNWPTTNPTSLTNCIYPLGGANYTFALLNVKSNSGYLMLTSTAVLGLPARSGYKLTKVVAHNSSQCSTTTVVGISSSASEASYITGGAAQTWSTTSSSYTYTLTSTEENTMYYLYVTNKNAQLIQLDLKYEEAAPNPAVATTTTIDDSGITNTDVYTSTAAGSLSATVTAGGSSVSGATITWSGDNDAVATINASTGVVTLVAAGNVTFTATYAGESGAYLASSDTYELEVTDSTPVTGTDVTFTAGTDKGTSTGQNPDTMTKDNVTISGTSAALAAQQYRLYSGSTTTISVAAGFTITKIIFNGTDASYPVNRLSVASGSTGTYTTNNNIGTWTGDATSVAFYANGQARAASIVVTIESTGSNPVISASPSELNIFSYLDTSTDPSAAQSISVSGANLTDNITVSVGNNSAFEISTTEEGTYTNNLTLTQTSGTVAAANVYVRMKANQTGNPTGTLTLSSTGATSVTIALNGSVVTPMTVAEAIAAINAATGNTVDDAYVSGVVCQIDEFNSSFNSITYWISDDGETTTKLEVYSGKGLNNANFTSINDLTVGDEVVVFGDLKKYNDIYEFNYNNYLVSFEHHIIPVINADNVSIAYNEEGGSIAYSISNGSGLVSATITTGNWLELGTITNNAVPFTCSANTGNERTANITLSFENAVNKEVVVTQSAYIPPFVPSTYTLATSIMPGKHYIIVGKNGDNYYAMGAQRDSNRGAVAVTLSNETITSVEGVYEFVVSGAKIGNTYTYYSIYDKTNTGYLYASSSSANQLKTENTLDDNGIWTITVSGSTSESTITAQGSYSRKLMRFNPNNGSPLFACYATNSTTGTLPYLYEKVDDKDLELYSDTYLSDNGHAITVPVDGTLTVNSCNLVNTGGADQLCFKDGAQLLGFTGNYVTATVQRNIEKYTAVNSKDHYYFVATPVTEGNDPATNSMISENPNDYDLYYFDQTGGTNDKEWKNYKQNNFDLVNGKGYLYARGDGDVTINFAGDINNNTSGSMALTYSSTAHLPGLNLVGNPYLVNITNMNLNGSAVSYYMLTTEGTFESTTAAETPIKVGRGFMVQATEGNTTLNLNPSSKDARGLDDEVIRLEVANSLYKDVAYIRFGSSVALNKINHINEDAPMLYINNENGDYAVAVYDNREEVKSVDVNFKANTLGKYTISAKAQNGNFSYMHLIDRLTGVDTDLLNDDYSFIGSKNDMAGRFVLRFESSNSTSVNETFAFQNGSDIIVNGEGELQIFDVMGRNIMNTMINGVQTVNVKSQGVYIFKLNEKTQKVIVR